MDTRTLPARPSLAQYRKQAKELVKDFAAGTPGAIGRVREHHPRLGRLADDALRRAKFALADAQIVIAREHGFASWPKFTKQIDALNRKDSPVARFEAAVDAVVDGNVPALQRLLREDPGLIRARSMREHHATLLHYVGANGVEDFRQRTPKNAVDVLNALLDAGAEVSARADLYGGATTLGLVATSIHPVVAGIQEALMEALLDRGASIDDPGAAGNEHNTVKGCLANGRPTSAAYLAAHGARLDLETAAGVGRLDVVRSFFNADGSLEPTATKTQLRDGFLWACQYGRTEVVEFLLRHGASVDPELAPARESPLHWAAYGGLADTLALLLEHGAPVSVRDDNHEGTPLDWALYGWEHLPYWTTSEGYYKVVALLVRAGATIDPSWFDANAERQPVVGRMRSDARMAAALRGEMS